MDISKYIYKMQQIILSSILKPFFDMFENTSTAVAMADRAASLWRWPVCFW